MTARAALLAGILLLAGLLPAGARAARAPEAAFEIPHAPPLPAPLPRLAEEKKWEALLRALNARPGGLEGRGAFLRGLALLRLGRHAMAIEALEEAGRALPALRRHALFLLAEAAEAAREDAAARRALGELLRHDPLPSQEAAAYEALARLAHRAGRHAEEARWAGRFLRRFADHDKAAEVLALRARALEEAARPREAALAWRALWLNHPESPGADEGLRRAEALAPLLRPPLPAPGAREHYLRARRLQTRYYHPQALAAYRELARRFPDSPFRSRAALNEAVTLYALRKTAEAGGALAEAARLFGKGSRERAEARYYLGRNHLRARERSAFEEEAALLLREAPAGRWAARTRYLLARVHEDDREYEEAALRYGEVVRLHAGSRLAPKARWQLAWIRYRTGEPRRAAAMFEKVAARFPDHPLAASALYWSGAAAEAAGERPRAVAQYRRCAQLFRHLYYGHLALAALERLRRGGDLDAVRPLALPKTGAAAWTRPPAGAPGGQTGAARWRAAAWLDAMGIHGPAGEEYERLGEAPYFRYRAALAFARGGAHDRAIAIVNASFWDALRSGGSDLPDAFWRIAYPLQVRRREPGGADPHLVNAVIRAESAFDPDALSRAGARGLMQIMPATGRRLARAHKLRLASEADLFDPEINTRLGARHLGALVREFGGALVPAIASYNAGRRAARRWWKARDPREPLAIFIERIPYEETRGYVKRVLGYYREYRRIYGARP